jgi:hypothetical protein
MALMPKGTVTPNAAIVTPAMAGPTTRDRLKLVELRAIALVRSSGGTSSAANAWRTGISMALTKPAASARR